MACVIELLLLASVLSALAAAPLAHVSPYAPHHSTVTPWFEGWYIRIQGHAGSAAFGIGTRCTTGWHL